MSSKNVIDLRKGVAKAPPVQQQTIRFVPVAQAPRLKSARNVRVSPVRARRQRTRYIILGIVAFLIALAVYGVSWVSYLPQYNLSSVTIVGTQAIPTTDVYNYVKALLNTPGHPFLSRNNIFLYNPTTLKDSIVSNFSRISSATISRSSPFATNLTVTVVERQSFAIWCSDDAHTDCYQMDSTGFIFAQNSPPDTANASSTDATSSPSSSESFHPPMYIFQGGLGFATSTNATSTDPSDSILGATTTQPVAMSSVTPTNPIGQMFVGAHMPGIVALLKNLSQAGFKPTGATVENDQDFWVPFVDGFYIKASFGENPGKIVSNLQLVLSSDALTGKESELQYVDLRFGDRVYYKLQGVVQMQH
jgi:hypothetical protein